MPKIAFVDLETTGISPLRDRIIEVAVIIIDDGIRTEYVSLVNPEVHIPAEITQITGLTSTDLRDAPLFSEIAEKVNELTEGALFVAHNARFDYAFLKHEFSRVNRSFSRKTLCTVRLTRSLFPNLERYNLDSVTNFFGLSILGRHRALGDASVLVDIYERSSTHPNFEEVCKKLLKRPTLPTNLSEKVLDSLPETAGVYTFVDKIGTVLYIGKSISVRTRVKSHFTLDYATRTDLALVSQVANVYVEETAGEVGALIREATLVKEVSPIYNRVLRRSDEMVVLLSDKTSEVFKITLDSLRNISSENIASIVGCFKSKKRAVEYLRDISREHKLCPKFLSLESGRGRCFASQLGACSGICEGAEGALEYNKRFDDCFSLTQIPNWSFGGPIIFTEESISKRESHVIYSWCYLGSVIEDKTSGEVQKNFKNSRFEWDTYKVISKALKKASPKSRNIKKITFEEVNDIFGIEA